MRYAPLSTSAELAELTRLQTQADRAAFSLAAQRRRLEHAAGTPPIAPAVASRLGVLMLIVLSALAYALL